MQKLSRDLYEKWRIGADVLEKDRYGEKVLRLADGTFLKLFRRKSWFSKNMLYPPAKRFADNATQLKRLAIACPTIIQVYTMSAPYRSVVHYEPLAGITLRQLFKENNDLDQADTSSRLAEFITRLHDRGVYFRSLHLGNIVLTPEGELGLIDISDMRCLDKPLSNKLRKRNYRHLMRYKEDLDLIDQGALHLITATNTSS
ncbi:lipopolysaccharide kinase InaA family protein [Pseudomonas saliphila]|uniref:lipopolysaccharide kinase InaA family protein n=1 Tax=Pseudomonas saliphila TaxID=2586906 RepID=UPI00123AE635|nr:lipopolysaccharide kinase InaA family protein [Pseudomonas saliphila]